MVAAGGRAPSGLSHAGRGQHWRRDQAWGELERGSHPARPASRSDLHASGGGGGPRDASLLHRGRLLPAHCLGPGLQPQVSWGTLRLRGWTITTGGSESCRAGAAKLGRRTSAGRCARVGGKRAGHRGAARRSQRRRRRGRAPSRGSSGAARLSAGLDSPWKGRVVYTLGVNQMESSGQPLSEQLCRRPGVSKRARGSAESGTFGNRDRKPGEARRGGPKLCSTSRRWPSWPQGRGP